jgi:hypothetical protein
VVQQGSFEQGVSTERLFASSSSLDKWLDKKIVKKKG